MPTIVGTPGAFPDSSPLQGTEGVDVVITHGAYGVDLLGGDDLLCITGEPDSVYDEHPPIYTTGAGDDRVDSSARTAVHSLDSATVFLGAGADEFVGGPLSDSVIAGDTSSLDLDADVIDTAAGSDSVFSGTNDLVRLGRGRDGLLLSTGPPGGEVEGGPARDSLSIWVAHHGEQSWRLDTRVGRLTRDGELVVALTSFASFGAHARGNFVFIGSDDDEWLQMNFNRSWTPRGSPIQVRMEGGNDRVSFWGGGEGARFDGGDGVDRFDFSVGPVDTHLSLIFNLKSGLLRDIRGNGLKTTRHAIGFEKAGVSNNQNYGPTTIKGTSEADWIKSWGPGPSTIYGREGDDEVIGLSCRVCGYHVLLVGGPGDDNLTGGRKFIGGPGDDVADGGPGFDRCNAEVRLHCEA